MKTTVDCEKFKEAFVAYDKEVKEHNIPKLLKDAERELKDLPVTDRKAAKLRKNIKDYNRYLEIHAEMKRLYDIACKGKKGSVDCDILLDAHDTWHEEIDKYKVNWMPYYKRLMKIYDELLTDLCSE
jgi:hypothetical protein